MPANIPDIVIGRLPVYLRALTRLAAEGHEVTSSHELGRRTSVALESKVQAIKLRTWLSNYDKS